MTEMNPYQQFICKSRYSRFLDDKNRREDWHETVARYFSFMKDHLRENYSYELDDTELKQAVLDMETMPSMRAIMTAGPALLRDNVASFNCSALPIDDPKAFDEAMYILLCGTGVGFSVESKHVNKLPEIPETLYESQTTISVPDSKEGWAKSLRQLIALLYAGEIPKWDVSRVREAGSRLKTFGGRASGPDPLVDLFRFVITKFKCASGRKLNTLECHDIMCKIGETVVVGGVRRCMPKGTRVRTENGLVNIEDIKVGDEIETVLGRKPVTAVFDQGIQETVLIKHHFGSLECTPNHKVAVFTDLHNWEFKAASDLSPGDRLVFDPGASGIQNSTNMPEQTFVDRSDNYRKPNSIVIPNLDEDIAWVIGFLAGDGYISIKSDGSGRVLAPLCDDHLQLMDKYTSIISRFGVTPNKPSDHMTTRKTDVKIGSVRLAHYFSSLIKTPNNPIEIPDVIKNGSISVRWAFLAGLFDADGCSRSLNGSSPTLVSTKYRCLAMDVKDLYLSLGILTRVDERRNGKNNIFTVKTAGNEIYKKIQDWFFWYSDKYHHESYTSRMVFTFPRSFVKARFGVNEIGDMRFVCENVSVAMIRKHSNEIFDAYPIPVISVDPSGRSVHTYDIEVADIHQFTADGFVVHNSAMISLSDLEDDRMRHSKSGNWWDSEPQRSLSNNSAVYDSKPDIGQFMREWTALYESKSGERGIFSREACRKKVAANGRRKPDYDWLTNPCSEIILRNNQFCNLTEVVVRASDTPDDIRRKIKLATILGTIQSSLTKFPYLRKIWKRNTEEERLLGVSITGILDNEWMGRVSDETSTLLSEFRKLAIDTNKEWAEKIGITPSVAITCVKPSGSVSSLVNSASGIHARHAKHYIRRVRNDMKDPMTQFMIDNGVPYEPCVMRPDSTAVFSFPMKAPDGGRIREDLTAIEHLELWLQYQRHWCEHKPSITVSVKENEWLEVGAWVYAHFDEMSGVSFLPWDTGTYKQTPFEAITEDQYNEMLLVTPTSIDWNLLVEYDDNVEGAQMLACSSGVCEI